MLFERIGEQVAQDPRVRRTHVDSRVDLTFLLAELKQEFEGVMSNLKVVGIAALFALPKRTATGSAFDFPAHVQVASALTPANHT